VISSKELLVRGSYGHWWRGRSRTPSFRPLASSARPQPRGTIGCPLSVEEILPAASKLGLEVIHLDVKQPEAIAPVIGSLNGRAQALYVVGDPLIADNQIQINTLALAARLPTMHGSRGYVETGGFVSYGPDFSDLFHRSGDYINKILKGAKPADLPVEEPTKIELVVNLKTAKALGLAISQAFLMRADAVIE
jgi:putative tryptophan/tyrosine transport system substrate-binding protein